MLPKLSHTRRYRFPRSWHRSAPAAALCYRWLEHFAASIERTLHYKLLPNSADVVCFTDDAPTPKKTERRLWGRTADGPIDGTPGWLRWHEHDELYESRSALREWLSDAAVHGVTLLQNVPLDRSGTALFDTVKLFGFVRETNYGPLFHVRTEAAPSNLAYTPVPLSVHTDNPYRDPVPGLQLLHCLEQADEGGVTTLVDGFAAAEDLRETNPAAFETLAKHDVQFRYAADNAVLESATRTLCLDAQGDLTKIRVNNRSLAPPRLPFSEMEQWYEALIALRQLLENPRRHLQFRMQPGDLVLLDNERVLHGRAGEAVGKRHLLGCYADRDGLLSTLQVLQSDQALGS